MNLPNLAQNLAAILTIALSVALIAALAAFVYAVVRELSRRTVLLDPIDVPGELAARGYSPAVVAERLLDTLLAIQREAPALKELRGMDARAVPIDLGSHGRFNLQAVVRAVQRLLRLPERRIGGEITREDDNWELTLRSRDRRQLSVLGVQRSGDLKSLLTIAAEDVLLTVDPWLLAHHYFSQERRDPSPEFARTLATLDHVLEHANATERAWALNLQGVCFMRQHQLLAAIDCFRAAADAGPGLGFIHQNWAGALDLIGRFDEARSHRIRALEIRARSAGVIADNAISASQLHRHAQALALARRALALAPRQPRTWSAWGQVLYGVHRFEQAASACERAIALGARDMLAPPLAMVYAALGRPEKALAVAHREIERVGENEDSLKSMGFARLAAGDARAAVSSFDAALAHAPGAGDAAYGRADALLALGEHELALSCYTRAVAIDPFFPQAHAGWAQALQALGRLEEAPPRFAVAVRVDAGYAPAYRGWAQALEALGRHEEAQPLLERAEFVERRNRLPLSLR
jgi:tetratricopeptide (TPR) repeat protein